MKLTYNFKCLDGEYKLIVENNEYVVETNIYCFSSKVGTIDNIELFIDLINKAKIENWDKEYLGETVEDYIEWSIEYIKDDKIYKSNGLESYEPYNYNYLIEAFKLIESNADYFKAGE